MLRAVLRQFKYSEWWRTDNTAYRHYQRKYAVNVPWWPTLENPWAEEVSNDKESQITSDEVRVDYEVSKDDFKWVEKLIAKPVIPPPPPLEETPTPSGWIAPNPELSSKFPYFVRRTKNHMLPVYYEEKQRKLAEQAHGMRQLTVIKHVDGDMWALAEDLRHLLQPKCEAGLFMCQVDEATRRIRIEGLFLEDVAQFLLSRGF
ncbi:39S ribosomal protein L49 mitochondrial [Fasciola hepatica]|uniref:Large ribosomal subunit protein mL49 n=1 Tax=Fasciola hepatica TaxID=6192 RepID=A0A2H1BU48_FASHE|nr:39S ribosomal protein L49 mitochondrial [Fasciola hepatica]